MHHALEMLRPGLEPDETETVIDVLMSMQATSFREQVVYELPDDLKQRDIENPDWRQDARERLGIIG